jgi:hypothetical protein
MIDKFREAIRLLSSNIGLFSLIVLTVWLPGNIIVNYFNYYVFYEEEFLGLMRFTMMIEGIFGPLYIGALIYALSRLKQDQTVKYSEAITVGFRNWGRLWWARFVAGLFISLGLIALIIPGILLAVRYALLDSVVILEGANASEGRKRSTELTTGKRWQIFGAGVSFFFGFIVFSFIIYLPIGFVEELDNIIISTALDCVLDVIYSVITIVLFLFYWESKDKGQQLDDEAVP